MIPEAHALLFDATHTLIELREKVGTTYARFAAEQGVDLPAWRIDDAFTRIVARSGPVVFDAYDEFAARCEKERAWWRQTVRGTFLATDNTVQFPDFDGLFRALWQHYTTGEAWQLRAGFGEALAVLAERGAVLGLVSNFDHRLPSVLDALGIEGFFRVVMLPSQCGLLKPDPGIFQAALEVLGVAPDEAVYIGDDPARDVMGAREAGLHGFSLAEVGDPSTLVSRFAPAASLPGS